MERLSVSLSVILILGSGSIMLSCNESGSKVECEKDGDCPEHWRCDVYAKVCRCVDDEGCSTPGERCMPDGTCKIFTGCRTDEDCPALHHCDVHTGDCLCSHDDACEEGEECNAAGHCQPLPGCFDNGDCAEGYFCDTPSRTCIPEGTCTTKFQCPIGQICTDSECVDGCEDHGDCPFKQPCIQGECVQGVCEDESFCDFLELCEDGSCMDATQAPYCKPCKKTNLLVCGDRLNPCLVYPYRDDPYDLAYPYFRNDDGSSNYCGTNCSQDQPCPNGFECRPIVTIKPATDFCQTDADCPGGLPCLKSAEEDEGYCPCHDVKNRCAENFCLGGDICQDGKCVLGSSEDAPVPCTQDSDCNLCMLTKEHCLIDGDCREIPCVVDPESGVDYGSCVVTMACGLMEGLHCPAP